MCREVSKWWLPSLCISMVKHTRGSGTKLSHVPCCCSLNSGLRIFAAFEEGNDIIQVTGREKWWQWRGVWRRDTAQNGKAISRPWQRPGEIDRRGQMPNTLRSWNQQDWSAMVCGAWGRGEMQWWLWGLDPEQLEGWRWQSPKQKTREAPESLYTEEQIQTFVLSLRSGLSFFLPCGFSWGY